MTNFKIDDLSIDVEGGGLYVNLELGGFGVVIDFEDKEVRVWDANTETENPIALVDWRDWIQGEPGGQDGLFERVAVCDTCGREGDLLSQEWYRFDPKTGRFTDEVDDYFSVRCDNCNEDPTSYSVRWVIPVKRVGEDEWSRPVVEVTAGRFKGMKFCDVSCGADEDSPHYEDKYGIPGDWNTYTTGTGGEPVGPVNEKFYLKEVTK